MVAYNGTIDAGISTQGVADYNNFQARGCGCCAYACKCDPGGVCMRTQAVDVSTVHDCMLVYMQQPAHYSKTLHDLVQS